MSILSFRNRNKKDRSHTSSTKPKQPRLYVLASTPSTVDRPETCEWLIELRIPASLPAVARPAPAPAKHSLLPSFSKKSDSGRSPPSADASIPPSRVDPSTEAATAAEAWQQQQPQTTSPPPADQHIYFSRFEPASHSTTPPQKTILRISVAPFLTPQGTTSDIPTLEQALVENLLKVHLTTDAHSWLRQALQNLQGSALLPSIAHGLKINNFMTFAEAYLTQHLSSPLDDTADPKQISYARILRQNERLRQMLISETTDYAVVNSIPAQLAHMPTDADPSDNESEEDAMWSQALPMRGHDGDSGVSQAELRRGSGAGVGTGKAFWFSHGPSAVSTQSPDRPRRSSAFGHDVGKVRERDIYGGLM